MVGSYNFRTYGSPFFGVKLRVIFRNNYFMRVASFFAGIGGFDLGLERAGHKVVFQCENDPFCKSILVHHWPNVAFIEDIEEIDDGTTIPEAEVWCGGFPCQDVSLARGGPRAGLKGARSGLFYKFARLVGQGRPPIIILENVPGLLSSHGGRDFGIVLQTLANFGYSVAWRVLNSRYFGVPQSRSRVYIVGHLGGPKRAGEILFEPERSRGESEESKESGENPLSPFRESLQDPSTGAIVQRLSYCLAATSGRHTGTDWSRSYVCYPDAVRRFTPEEYERLQGFPAGWTYPTATANGNRETVDSPRYKALGNAVTVQVAEWIGQRIVTVGL